MRVDDKEHVTVNESTDEASQKPRNKSPMLENPPIKNTIVRTPNKTINGLIRLASCWKGSRCTLRDVIYIETC